MRAAWIDELGPGEQELQVGGSRGRTAIIRAGRAGPDLVLRGRQSASPSRCRGRDTVGVILGLVIAS